MNKEIFPVVIVKSRYGGCYEGAKWLAFNGDFNDIQDCNGDDISCANFFSTIDNDHIDVKNIFDEKILVGRGTNPQEAYEDLIGKIAIYNENRRKNKTYFAGNKINTGDLLEMKEDGKIYSIRHENTTHSNTKGKKSKSKTT